MKNLKLLADLLGCMLPALMFVGGVSYTAWYQWWI